MRTLKAAGHPSAQERIEPLRAQIGDLQERIEALREGPIPKPEARDKLTRWVDARAAEADLASLVTAATTPHPLGAALAVTAAFTGFANGGQVLGRGSVDVGPIICALFAEQVKARLLARLDEVDYAPGPPSPERAGRIEALARERTALEVEEERLISEAQAAGVFIERRADCDPAIVLEDRA